MGSFALLCWVFTLSAITGLFVISARARLRTSTAMPNCATWLFISLLVQRTEWF